VAGRTVYVYTFYFSWICAREFRTEPTRITYELISLSLGEK